MLLVSRSGARAGAFTRCASAAFRSTLAPSVGALLALLTACQDPAAPADAGRFGALDAPGPLASASPAPHAGDVIPDEYIVTFRDDEKDVPGLAKQLAAQHGGTVRFTYTAALRGFAARLPAQAVEALQRNPQIAQIEQDRFVPLADIQTYADWGLDRIDQRSLPLNLQYDYPSTGSGVSVYIIDTGIRLSHSEFGGRATAGYTSINDGLGAGDCGGHGTHVAGIVGSRKYGVAKGASLVSVRVYDCAGNGTMSGLLGGIDWVTRNARKPAVANMSMGGASSFTLDQAVQSSIHSGITYVVSAGNYSKDACTISPARVPAAITVGATDESDAQATFSDFGSCVDLYAPGVSILSTYYTSDTASYYLSGTSMAAPFASGAAALYLSANPQASPATVSDALTVSSTVSALRHLGSGSPNRLLFVGGFAAPVTTVTPTPPPPAVDAPPVASVTASCARSRCTLDASASVDDKGIVSYTWNFGDGSPVASGASATIAKSYATAGVFTVTVTVTDGSGQSARAQRAVSIKRV
jgi:subtilisin family serine protease